MHLGHNVTKCKIKFANLTANEIKEKMKVNEKEMKNLEKTLLSIKKKYKKELDNINAKTEYIHKLENDCTQKVSSVCFNLIMHELH